MSSHQKEGQKKKFSRRFYEKMSAKKWLQVHVGDGSRQDEAFGGGELVGNRSFDGSVES